MPNLISPDESKYALVVPPVFILTISVPKESQVFESDPPIAAAEADPSTPEIPVVPLSASAIIIFYQGYFFN